MILIKKKILLTIEGDYHIVAYLYVEEFSNNTFFAETNGESSSKLTKTETSSKPGSASLNGKPTGAQGSLKTKLSNGFPDSKSKLTNGKQGDKSTSIQKDSKATSAYKSLFTSSEKAKNQQSAHWVTFNPFYN